MTRAMDAVCMLVGFGCAIVGLVFAFVAATDLAQVDPPSALSLWVVYALAYLGLADRARRRLATTPGADP
jgi:hypothetical protein